MQCTFSSIAVLGILQTHLPASVFSACCTQKFPMNTLFADVDGFSVSFEEMQKYLPLILAFYDVSPMGFLSWLGQVTMFKLAN